MPSTLGMCLNLIGRSFSNEKTESGEKARRRLAHFPLAYRGERGYADSVTEGSA